MKRIVENVHQVLYDERFRLLPFELVLQIVSHEQLVIRSERDVFVAVIRWVMWRTTCEVSEVPADGAVEGANEH